MSDHRFIYLAHPIDQNYAAPDSVSAEMYRTLTEARSLLTMGGAGSYDPEPGWSVPRQFTVGPEINQVNNEALQTCTGVLALLPVGMESFGVPIEVAEASRLGKPVALVTRRVAIWAAALPRVTQFRGVEEAVRWLLAQTPGEDTRKVDEGAKGRLPYHSSGYGGVRLVRTYPDDAGLDVLVSEDTEVPPGEFTDIPSGVHVELPAGTWGLLTGRSSTLRKRGLLVHSAVIDVGYRGEIFAGAWNMTDKTVDVLAGERVAQLILLPNVTEQYETRLVSRLEPSPRGTNGFGSSGL